MDIVILELSSYDRCPFEVRYTEVGGWRDETDSTYRTKAAALARAEVLIGLPGIANVRVVKVVEDVTSPSNALHGP